MAAVIPRNLQLMAGRMSNMERTVVRVRPMSNDSVGAGQTIHFRLPTNTLIDLHNLQLWGTCKIDSSEYQPVWGLPRKMEQCIERVDIVANGQSINGNNIDYGAYDHLMRTWKHDENVLLQNEYLESGDNKVFSLPVTNLTATNKGSSGVSMRTAIKSALAPTSTEGSSIYTYRSDPKGGGNGFPREFPFLINGLPGLLSGKFIRFIDTAVLGPVEVRLRLHQPNIMYKNTESVGPHGMSTYHDRTRALTADPAGTDPAAYNSEEPPDYSWENMYMILDTISFPDDFYRSILAERLSGGGIISIPYPNVFSFTKAMSSNSDTITFNLAAQSLDNLVATFRNMMYIRRNGKRFSPSAANSNYFKFVSADNTDYSRGNFTSKTNYQWMVNNKLMPSWPVTVDEAHALTRAALDQAKFRANNERGTTFKNSATYRDGLFMFMQSLQHHSEGDKIISGMDTRGASSNMALSVTDANVGGGSADGEGQYNQIQVLIWALTTSSLEISAGQNITTIF